MIERFKPLENKEIFDGCDLIINSKHLVSLTLEKLSREKAIFEDDPNANFIFTDETLQMVVEGSLVSEKHLKKDILSIFANQNPKLVQKILDLEIFDKIIIINDINDYEPQLLNIRQGSNLGFELLEKIDLKLEICIKFLVNPLGEMNLRDLSYLWDCVSFMREDGNHFEKSRELLLQKLDLISLQTIKRRFSMMKYVCYFVSLSKKQFSKEELERIIILNQSLIDGKVLGLILNNYHYFNDNNQVWLQETFKKYECMYSNLDYASWILANFDDYKSWGYFKLPEFYTNYCFYDENIVEYFAKNEFFLRRLVRQKDVVSFLEKALANPFNPKWKYPIS